VICASAPGASAAPANPIAIKAVLIFIAQATYNVDTTTAVVASNINESHSSTVEEA
jgi:hypothetical protein